LNTVFSEYVLGKSSLRWRKYYLNSNKNKNKKETGTVDKQEYKNIV